MESWIGTLNLYLVRNRADLVIAGKPFSHVILEVVRPKLGEMLSNPGGMLVCSGNFLVSSGLVTTRSAFPYEETDYAKVSKETISRSRCPIS